MQEVLPFVILSNDSKVDIEYKRNQLIILANDNLKYIDQKLYPDAQKTFSLFHKELDQIIAKEFKFDFNFKKWILKYII